MSHSPSARRSSASPSKEVVFHCEYAPSGRAKCRVCLNSILKSSLRLAVSLPLAEPSLPEPQDERVTKQRRIAAEAPQWCHANCFRKYRASAKWWREHVYPAVRWIGFSELNSPDQTQVRRFVAACENGEEPTLFWSEKEPRRRTGTTDTEHAGGEGNIKSGDVRVATAEERKRSRSQTEKSRLKGKEKQREGPEERSTKKGTISAKDAGSEIPSRGAKRSASGDGEIESKRRHSRATTVQERKRPATNEGAGKMRKAEEDDMQLAPADPGEESIGLALTARQQRDIEKQLEKTEKESAATLRSLLRMNNQKISGVKEELAYRVAECRVLGAVPKCPQCREGFLRFDGNTGEYRCPGYVNEEGEYERCSFKSTAAKRPRWNE